MEAHNRLKGMFLFAAYGDAMGADHERLNSAHPHPLPSILPFRNLPTKPNEWGTWVPRNVLRRGIAVFTDDTCFRFYILHAWLRSALQNSHPISEASFRAFLPSLVNIDISPSFLIEPRNTQATKWLEMYNAHPNDEVHFLEKETPTVFGLFMFLELAALFAGRNPLEVYRIMRSSTILDFGYASVITGLMGALLSMAFASKPESQRFDTWLIDNCKLLINELKSNGEDEVHLDSLEQLVETMDKEGAKNRALGESEFVSKLDEILSSKSVPAPFMKRPFKRPVFDPFRFLAQIIASASYSSGNVAQAIKLLSFSGGDSDTMATFLGSIAGAWQGYDQLSNFGGLGRDLEIVEQTIRTLFNIDLDEHIRLFESLIQSNKKGGVAFA